MIIHITKGWIDTKYYVISHSLCGAYTYYMDAEIISYLPGPSVYSYSEATPEGIVVKNCNQPGHALVDSESQIQPTCEACILLKAVQDSSEQIVEEEVLAPDPPAPSRFKTLLRRLWKK